MTSVPADVRRLVYTSIRTVTELVLLFSIAFGLEGLSRVLLATEPDPSEGRLLFYLFRLVAYTIILAGIAPEEPSRSALTVSSALWRSAWS